MKTKQIVCQSSIISEDQLMSLATISPQLILVFASVAHFQNGFFTHQCRNSLPEAQWIGCSTAGEISTDGVTDNTAVITAIHFDHPEFKLVKSSTESTDNEYKAGQEIAEQLLASDLKHILVLGQGVNVNGSLLIKGIKQHLPDSVLISGGLAGDAGKFEKSYTLTTDGISSEGVVAVGFYGDHIHLATSSFGGWRTFGTARLVTRASGNILYELDGKPALELYKTYLGDYAKDLPASGLLFPFAILNHDHQETGIIRTILGINEADASLTLAGDLIEGGYMRLMHASTDSLIDGAQTAAEALPVEMSGLALLVSCVGRKLLMGARVEEEVEVVANILGNQMTLTGFYSNGEISPAGDFTECKLHNQTMTITCLSER